MKTQNPKITADLSCFVFSRGGKIFNRSNECCPHEAVLRFLERVCISGGAIYPADGQGILFALCLCDTPVRIKTSSPHRQVLEGSLRRQALEGVQDAGLAPVLVHEQDALGGALLPAAGGYFY